MPARKPPPPTAEQVASFTTEYAAAREYPKLSESEEKELKKLQADVAKGKTLSHAESLRKAYLELKAGIETPESLAVKGISSSLDFIGDAIVELGKVIWDELVKAMSQIFDWLKRYVFDPLLRLLEGVVSALGDAIGSAMAVALTAITSMVHPGSPLEPWMALPAFGTIAASMLAVQTTFLSVNAAHPLKYIIGDTANAMVCKFLGFEHLASAFWGSIGAEVLDHPIRLWARQTFRARVPRHEDADRMLWHGQIDERRWHELHEYEGWPDQLITAHHASMWRNPSIRELQLISDAVGFDAQWVRSQLAQLGYQSEDADAVLAVLSRRPLIDELRALKTDTIKDAVEGAITLAELDQALAAVGVTQGELELIHQIVAIRAARAQRKALADEAKAWQSKRVTALTEAYRRGLLTEEEYLEELLAAGVSQSVAAETVYLEEIRLLPKPRRPSAEVVAV